MTTLVAADLRGIQGFVFSSRQLLDAIGRAAQVSELTDPTRPDLAGMLRRHGGEVIVAGAGGLLVSFADTAADPEGQPPAKAFTAEWTRWVYDTTDHLHAVVAHLTDDGPGTAHPGRISAVLRRARAAADTTHEPFLSPGFTASCAVTGRPAALLTKSESRGKELLSREIADARQVGRDWHKRQSRELLADSAAADAPWTLTTHLEELGRQTGELSKLAVLHADINGLGAALSQHANDITEYTARQEGPAPLPQREVSTAITAVITALHRHLVTTVINAARLVDSAWQISGFPANLAVTVAVTGDERPVVPIRPIVAAGDDLTVVCDARLAWSLTRLMLDWLDTPLADLPPEDPRRVLAAAGPVFQRSGPAGAQVNVTIGVGIAAFNVGAPFATAYDAAADICRWAKDHRRDAGWSDHVVAWTRPDRPPAARLSDADELRAAGLTQQPYTGDGFRDLLDGLLGDTPGSLRSVTDEVPRSWLKSLYTVVGNGPKAFHAEVTRRNTNSAVTLPRALVDRILVSGSNRRKDSWARATPILDALGLLDLHLAVPHPDSAVTTSMTGT